MNPNFDSYFIALSNLDGSSIKESPCITLRVLFFKSLNPLKKSNILPKSSLFIETASALIVKSLLFKSSFKEANSTFGSSDEPS